MSTMRTARPSTARRLTGLAASAVLATAGLLATGGTAQAAYDPGSATIWNDEPLKADDWHVDNGPARLIMQKDGNLVVYVNGNVRWTANTQGCGAKAVMQTDGNFVVYGQNGNVCWESHTAQNQRGTHYDVVKLRLDSDGTLTIYGAPNVCRNLESTAPYSTHIPTCGTEIQSF